MDQPSMVELKGIRYISNAAHSSERHEYFLSESSPMITYTCFLFFFKIHLLG